LIVFNGCCRARRFPVFLPRFLQIRTFDCGERIQGVDACSILLREFG
jgi:hypothetical protein